MYIAGLTVGTYQITLLNLHTGYMDIEKFISLDQFFVSLLLRSHLLQMSYFGHLEPSLLFFLINVSLHSTLSLAVIIKILLSTFLL